MIQASLFHRAPRHSALPRWQHRRPFFHPQMERLEGRDLPSFLVGDAYTTAEFPARLAAGDFNGDAVLDLATARTTPSYPSRRSETSPSF